MLPFFLINGEPSSELPLNSRGLHYGDGLFTTIAVVDGKPLLWSYHWARLCHGAKVLQLALPCEQTCYQSVCDAVAGLAACVVKYLWMRDHNPLSRGYRPAVDKRPICIIGVYDKPAYPPAYWQQGITLAEVDYPITLSPVLAGIKHLNRLDQVLASGHLARAHPDAQEGVYCNAADEIVGGIKSNIFLVEGQVIYTPAQSLCVVNGIMRAYLINALGEQGYQVRETHIARNRLHTADAIFLTNALIGLWPVQTMGARTYVIPALVRQCQALVCEKSFGVR